MSKFILIPTHAPKSALCLLLLSSALLGCSRQKSAESVEAQGVAPAPAPADTVTAASGGPVGLGAEARLAERHVKRKAGAPMAPASEPVMAAEMKDEANFAPEQEANVDMYRQDFHTESYDSITENRFVSAMTSPLSTFSIDVDTASYSNVRRFLSQGSKPPAGAVRIEELINYFDYDYPAPQGDQPLAVHAELAPAPWAPEHRLLHIGMQGKRIEQGELPPRNLTFLLDVSGSMDDPNKLPLLKRSFSALLETMDQEDTVAIVVYAGASGMVLPPTRASHKRQIFEALDRLSAGGSTNGGEGIELAYRLASRHFRPDGVNRVILATDGDFNIGTTSRSELVRLIERERESGVFLTVLGFGMGNYKDDTLEQLADKGNGNYAYIDTFAEARKVLVEQGGANLVTIAKDVKIQIEMNPKYVGAYRLIGYENRALRAEDFSDDRKDAGEVGAGHTVTAIYEILTPEQARQELSLDGLKYQTRAPSAEGESELATVKIRYKAPQGSRSQLSQFAVSPRGKSLRNTTDAFRFSAAVASFGMLLRGSEYAGRSSFGMVEDLAQGALGRDRGGYRAEFLDLARQAARL